MKANTWIYGLLATATILAAAGGASAGPLIGGSLENTMSYAQHTTSDALASCTGGAGGSGGNGVGGSGSIGTFIGLFNSNFANGGNGQGGNGGNGGSCDLSPH